MVISNERRLLPGKLFCAEPGTNDPCRVSLAVFGLPHTDLRSYCAGWSSADPAASGNALVREAAGVNCPGDFTILIDGGIGPQPLPNFIGVSDPPTLRGGSGEVAGAGEDGREVTA